MSRHNYLFVLFITDVLYFSCAILTNLKYKNKWITNIMIIVIIKVITHGQKQSINEHLNSDSIVICCTDINV
jgi:hypothetical protein